MFTRLTNPISIRAAEAFEAKLFAKKGDTIKLYPPDQEWLGDGSTDNKLATTEEQKLSFQCGVCNHVWRTRPFSITSGCKGCPSCAAQANSDSWGTRRHPRATETEKQRARNMYASGMTLRQVADELGRSMGSINNWCNPEVAERSRQRSVAYRANNLEAHRAAVRRHQQQTPHGHAAVKADSHARRGIRQEWNCEENAMVTVYEPELCGSGKTEFNEISEQLRQWNLKDDGIKYSLEHLLPITHGGSALGWWNLSITTLEDNLSKNSKILPEHMALRRHKIVKMFSES